MKAFWRDRWIVLGIGLLAGLVSVAYAITRKPMFTSEALLAPTEEDDSALGALGGVLGQVSALTGALGMPRIGGTSVEEVAAVLRSRDFSLRFIREHDLLPILFPERDWPERAPSAEPGAPPTHRSLDDVEGKGPRLRTEDVIDRFNAVRKIAIDRRTNFITLSMQARDPRTAQRIAQAMIDDVNAVLRKRALAEARLAEEFLKEKIASAQYETIKNTSAALMESQLKKQVLAESRADFAVRVLDSPSLPETRSYPRRTRMVIIGGLLGGMFACCLVLWRQRRFITGQARVGA